MKPSYDFRYARVMHKRGAIPPIERVTGERWPKHPATNDERIESWRRLYKAVPVELRNKPVKRHPRAVFVTRTKPEPLPNVVPLRRRA